MVSSKKRNVLEPDHHPGSILLHRMKEQGKSLPQVARDSGVPIATLEALINHEIEMTEELEIGLPKAFDGFASNWEWVQDSYDVYVLMAKAFIKAEAEAPLLERFHAHEAIIQGWTELESFESVGEHVFVLREHLEVEELSDVNYDVEHHLEYAAVIGDTNGYFTEALALWFHKGEKDFQKLATTDFNPDGFRNSLFGSKFYARMFNMLRRSPFAALPQLSNICTRNGVGLVIMENMPDIGATGAVRYDDDKPWIQITFNQQWMDQFWFDFFRLAAHIVLHHGQRILYMSANSDATNNGTARNGAAHVASANGVDGTDATHHDQESPDEVIRIGEIDTAEEVARESNGASEPERVEKAQRLAKEAQDLASKRLTDQTTEGEADYGDELRWNTFASHQNITARYIETQADKHGVHPGLLVNRLIREGLIPPDLPGINRLRTRVNLRERSKLRAFNV